MSSIDLVILGLIKKQPMSGYELNQFVNRIQLKKWIKIGSPTIYQNLKKLAAKGLLGSETVREGEMPEKVLYRLTAAGESHMMDLMRAMADDPAHIYFEFNALVRNLDLVDPEAGLELLAGLKRFFESGLADLSQDIEQFSHEAPLGMRAIMKQYQMTFQSLIEWVDWLIKEYRKTGR